MTVRYSQKNLNVADEWYTPSEIVDLAREVLGSIDLDPASNDEAQEWIKATKYHTIEDSGLDKPWIGKVWCNPPYSAKALKLFINKFMSEYKNGNMTEGIILTNSGTDTLWNVPLVEGLQVYTLGRIGFKVPGGETKGKGSRGSCFTYVGPNHKKFIEVFTKDGFCWVPNKNFII